MLAVNWIALGLIGTLAVGIIVLVVGALASLDWGKKHRKTSAALDTLREPRSQADGLVAIQLGALTFRARVANLSGTGDAVILLHGFPQTSAAWEPLMAAAADQGYRVAAFDQRGYSAGARPVGKDAYTLDKLVADVLGVADALGFERFHLVGHDWGAAVGWGLVMTRPERILSWSALSIAHAYAFAEALRSDADQRRRSRYFLLFRTPVLPELLLTFNRLQVFRSVMYRWMPGNHVEEYQRVFAEPGALTAVLNWYRAAGRGDSGSLSPAVRTPVLFVWGNRDPAAGRKAVELQAQYLEGPYEFIELDAGHWLLERRTDIVIDAVLRHIRKYRSDHGSPAPR